MIVRKNNCGQQLGFRRVRSTNDETAALPVPKAKRIGRTGEVLMGIESGFFEGNKVSN